MRLLKWLLLAVLLLTGVSCKEKTVSIFGKRSPHQYRTAVSLSPSTTELAVTELGLTIEGRTASCNYPPNVKSFPIVMKGIKPDYEKIEAMRPDVVLYDPSLFSQSDIAKFKDLKIDTLPIAGDSLAEFIDYLYKAGAACGAESQVSDYVDLIQKFVTLAKTNAANPPQKVAIVAPGQGSEHMVAGVDGFLGDMLRQIGAEPVGPKGKIFQNMNVEGFIKDDPDVIIVAGDPAGLFSDARLQAIKAFKSRHLAGIDQDMVMRRGARVDQLVRLTSAILVKFK